jgi:hypothetical protein
MLDRIFGKTTQQPQKVAATAPITQALEAYIITASADTSKDMTAIREELALAVGWDLASRLVQRIAQIRNMNAPRPTPQYCEEGAFVQFNAKQNVETR